MKNILMSLILTASLVLSACTGCKKEERKEMTTEVAAPAAPEATTAPTEVAPSTEAAPETK